MPVIVALFLQLQPGIPIDSVESIREAARRAEARFERLARSLAPMDWSAGSGGECDEIVGRFCLIYDEGRLPDPKPEGPAVTDARREAIEALRLAFSHEPGRLETTGPLVRYLVEDERASEAVSAARTYAVLTRDSVWGPLLLGFALHALGNDSAAERHFDAGLAQLPPDERRRVQDVRWILSGADRGIYEDATHPGARDSLERLVWRHSDPLYLTPGNERRAEHIARHVWSRILSMTPRVREMLRWGEDLDELTVRYGVPAARTRTWGTIYREGSLIEHYDPDQLAYVQSDLFTRGPAPSPPPGDEWPLGEARARSGYAPRTLRRLVPLEHQVTRFPSAVGHVLRVDARLVLDTVAADSARGPVAARLEVRTATDLEPIRIVPDSVALGDTVRIALEAPVPGGALLYSVEALEPATRLAGRARYALDIEAPAGGFDVSDPLVAHPWPADEAPAGRHDVRLRPRSRLVFAPGEELGLYAEAWGLAAVAGESRYEVELSIRRADRASFPARALSWLGRTLGLSSERVPPRVSWRASAPATGPAIIAVTVPLTDVSGGLHSVVLAVTDLVTGETRESSRIVRIEG